MVTGISSVAIAPKPTAMMTMARLQAIQRTSCSMKRAAIPASIKVRRNGFCTWACWKHGKNTHTETCVAKSLRCRSLVCGAASGLRWVDSLISNMLHSPRQISRALITRVWATKPDRPAVTITTVCKRLILARSRQSLSPHGIQGSNATWQITNHQSLISVTMATARHCLGMWQFGVWYTKEDRTRKVKSNSVRPSPDQVSDILISTEGTAQVTPWNLALQIQIWTQSLPAWCTKLSCSRFWGSSTVLCPNGPQTIAFVWPARSDCLATSRLGAMPLLCHSWHRYKLMQLNFAAKQHERSNKLDRVASERRW